MFAATKQNEESSIKNCSRTAAEEMKGLKMKLYEVKITANKGEKVIKPSCAQLGIRRYYLRKPSKAVKASIFRKCQNSKHLCNEFGAMNFNIDIEIV